MRFQAFPRLSKSVLRRNCAPVVSLIVCEIPQRAGAVQRAEFVPIQDHCMNHHSTTGQAHFADQTPISLPSASDLPVEAETRDMIDSPPSETRSSHHAELELTAALRASSERVRYITGASGVALALCETEADEMVCRAGSGPTAPEVGTRMHIQSGITAESIRTRQTLRCDEASTDPRVNQETCRALGIESVMVLPLIVGGGVVGIFELFGHQPSAFGERDAKTLQGAAQSVQLALERAVSIGFTLGHIPWALVIEKPPVKLLENSMETPIDPMIEQPFPDEITLRTPVVFPVSDFPETEEASEQPMTHDHSEPVPAFLARLADEARPTASKRWSQWFRPQW